VKTNRYGVDLGALTAAPVGEENREI